MKTFRLFGMVMAAILVGGIVTATVLAHDRTVTATIDPPDGATISAPSTSLTATFGGFGEGVNCGLETTITATVSSGAITDESQSCGDGGGAVWTWTATWSGYAEGSQTVTVDFLQAHAQAHGQGFTHSGTVSATYTVDLASEDCPAAPAVAARLLREAGLSMKDETTKNYIAQVADHMGPQTDFDGVGKCDLEPYEAAVRAFLVSIGALS